MRTATSLHLSRLLLFLLLMSVCCRLAIAQNEKAAPTLPPATSATTKAAQTTQAPTTPETTPSPDAQPAKESERLPSALDDTQETNVEAPSAAGLLFRTLGALLLIVGLVVAAGWGLRRFGGARFGAKRKDSPELSVLTSVSLGNRRSLAIVRFGERNLLIGSTGQSVTLLATEDMMDAETQIPTPRSVADLLKAGEAKEFEQELEEASETLDSLPSDWRAGGGAA